jgi:hypothetical protein
LENGLAYLVDESQEKFNGRVSKLFAHLLEEYYDSMNGVVRDAHFGDFGLRAGEEPSLPRHHTDTEATALEDRNLPHTRDVHKDPVLLTTLVLNIQLSQVFGTAGTCLSFGPGRLPQCAVDKLKKIEVDEQQASTSAAAAAAVDDEEDEDEEGDEGAAAAAGAAAAHDEEEVGRTEYAVPIASCARAHANATSSVGNSDACIKLCAYALL